MASFVKYNQFVSDLTNKVHDLNAWRGRDQASDTCKVMLNATPAPTVT